MNAKTLPTEDNRRAIEVDIRGRMAYRTAADSGHIEIEIPSLPGSPNPTERLHAADFGEHVAGKIESALKRNPYLTVGPTQTPATVLAHYAAVAKGSGLMDPNTVGTLESLARGFRQERDSREYFRRDVRPFLLSLLPKRRQP